MPQPPAAAPVAAPLAPPTDGQTAFLDGYRAYKSHDNLRAIDHLKFAADNFPALGDYALLYLALAQHDQGDLNASAKTLDRLIKTYPDSVMISSGELMLADNLLNLGGNAEASVVAARLIARNPEASIEQGARIAEAKSLIAIGNPKSAYAQLMELRDKYPHSDSDAEARVLVREILAAHPEVTDTNSLAYHRAESELLLREGALSEADEQANAGLAMSPEPAVRAELVWVTARALKPEPDRAKRAILEYLQVAPQRTRCCGGAASARADLLARRSIRSRTRDAEPAGREFPGQRARAGRDAPRRQNFRRAASA